MNIWSGYVEPALREQVQVVLGVLPRLLGALVILVIGWIIASGVSALAHRLLRRIGLNQAAEQSALKGLLRGAGYTGEVSRLIGRLIFWFVMVVFLLTAAETLQMPTLANALQDLVYFIPNLIAVVLVLVLGSLLARFVGSLVRGAATDAGLDFGDLLGKVVNYAILVAVIIIAVAQLNIESNVLDIAFAAFLGAFALAAALVLGLGSRDVAGNILAGVYARKIIRPGQTVAVDRIRGRVVHFGTVTTLIETESGMVSLPNKSLLEGPTHIHNGGPGPTVD